MTYLPLRSLSQPTDSPVMAEWLDALSDALADPTTDRPVLCRRTLADLAYPE